MNNRPVEQALATLIPTHAADLPHDLVSLALSLVAQSRSFSSSLKPEEEIARPFACAEIACRRLSRALKLPPLLGNPPCPPTAYKKLYKFLDQSLSKSASGLKRSASASVPGTPSRTGSAPSTPSRQTPRPTRTPPKATPSRGLEHTPSKSTSLKPTEDRTRPSQTPQRSFKIRSNGLPTSTIIPDAPAWVMTSIRTVCKTLSTPAPRTNTWSRPPISRTFPPHMFAGVSSILYFISQAAAHPDVTFDEEIIEFIEPVMLTKDADRDKDEDFKELVNALIVAVYFLVLARRRDTSSEEDPAGESRKLDKKTFSEMRQTALSSLALPATERRHRDDVDQWIAVIMEQGWANEQEWFENIPRAGELDGDEADFSGDEEAAEDEEVGRKKRQKKGGSGPVLMRDTRKGLLPGLGTMMQDRVDWLSEDRMEDYAEWRGDMMARIQEIESAV